ncbi:MAG: WbqC-like family protein, partial [Flavipsychrobacter sp.]|nr:WbqC-like family protein [Flavipsychrobacter sp.]
PYIFPYIGYFQLVHCVDRFVMYDDVSFIKQGWINRNKVLLNGQEHIFTVPLKNASSFVTIANTEVNRALYDAWLPKFLKTLTQAYAKAPHYHAIYDLVSGIMNGPHETIGILAANSIIETGNYLGITTEFKTTATGYHNSELKAKDRVIDICKTEGATQYINPIGGKDLYLKEDFAANGIQLNFVKTHKITYPQLKNEFVPWLSIIDVMMFNDAGTIMGYLNDFGLD